MTQSNPLLLLGCFYRKPWFKKSQLIGRWLARDGWIPGENRKVGERSVALPTPPTREPANLSQRAEAKESLELHSASPQPSWCGGAALLRE